MEENLVKKTCKELGITQKELGLKIGITEKTISGWANSKAKLPKNFLPLDFPVKLKVQENKLKYV